MSSRSSNSQRGSESSSQYRGVRVRRWGKWVSEIRDPQKKKRIWLGSFRSEMEAAHAFDAAALMCLRNPIPQLNFPDHYYKLPSGSPGHYSTRQIQAAAAAAAAASVGRSFSYHQFISSCTSTSSDSDDAQELEDITYTESTSQHCYVPNNSASTSSYFDEDVNLVSEMARGMLMDPPSLNHDDDDDDDNDNDGGYNHYTGPSFWS